MSYPTSHILINRCIARNKQSMRADKTQFARDSCSIYYAIRDGKPQNTFPHDFETARRFPQDAKQRRHIMNVSIYRNTKDTNGITRPLREVHKRIRDGKDGLAEATQTSRRLTLCEDKDAYRDYKAQNLTAFTPAGIFQQGRRKAQYLQQHSSHVVLDIDGLTQDQVTELLIFLHTYPHLRLAFISPSGAGVKIVLEITPTPKNASEHKAAYTACVDHFTPVAEDFGFDIDTSGSDCSRLCFLAHHPQAIWNDDTVPIEWDYGNYQQGQEKRKERLANRVWADTDVDISALEYVPLDLPYDQWLTIGMGIKSSGLSFSVWEQWTQGGKRKRSTGEWITEDIRYKWDTFSRQGQVTWGTVVYYASLNGYIPPRQHHKPIKLHKTNSQLILETLQRSREFLVKVFDSTTKIFGLRADTGVGKNEAAIQHLYKGVRLMMNLPHKNLMNELAGRFEKAEITPFAYRGILSDPTGTFPHESPCITPQKYDAYAQKGGNPRKVICSRCSSRGLCEEAGHWYDLRQLRKHQVNLFTFPQLFTNPIFRGRIQSNIVNLESDDLILHDDTEITELYTIIEVKREYLEALSRDHKGTTTGDFANVILSLLHQDDLYDALRDLVFDTDRDEIIESLSQVRVNGELMTLDDAVEKKLFPIQTEGEINRLPIVQSEDWNLITQLEIFFDIYQHGEDAPIRYNDGILSFAIKPILPKTKARIGFMGATLQEDHLKRSFPDAYSPNVQFFDAMSTEWHPDARVFQLSTNRNPRRTVLTDGKLNTTGQAYFDSVMESVRRLNGKHALISYKSVIEEKQDVIQQYDLVSAHFGGLTGLDTLFEDVDYLHILFAPERPPFALEWNAKMIYGSDNKVLSFDRDEAGNWEDQRVQSVYNAGVIAELIQAIGRARLVSNGKKVFVWCSHYLPTITDRDQTHLFTERDIALWNDGNIATLEKIISERSTATQKQIAEQEGISERAAYKREAGKAKKQKTERDKEILRLDKRGHKQADIAMHVGCSQKTVSNVIRKHRENL